MGWRRRKFADDEDSDVGPRPKRPLWRRLLKWLFVTVGVLLLLILLFVGFMHTGPGKDFARGIVEDRLNQRYDGKVTLGELDYALFGDIAIGDLSIKEHSGKQVVGLKRVEITPAWSTLLSGAPVLERVAIHGADLDIVQFEDGTSNLRRMQRQPTKLPNALTIEALDVKDVRVKITAPDGRVTELDGLTVAGLAAFDQNAKTADVDISKLAVAVTATRPNGTIISLPLDTGVTLKQQGETISVTLKPLQTTAHLKRPGKPDMDIPVKLGGLTLKRTPEAIDAAITDVLAGPLTMAGLTVTARLGPDGLPAGDQSVALAGVIITKGAVNALLGREALLSDIRVDLGVTGPPQALVIGGVVDTDGGKLALNGTVDVSDPANPSYDILLAGTDIDSKKLLAGEKAPDVKTAMTLTVKGQGIGPDTMSADVTFVVPRLSVNGKSIDGIDMAAKARGQQITIDDLTIKAFGQRVTLNGTFDRRTRQVMGRILTVTPLAEAVANARDAGVIIVPLPPLAGLLDVDLTVNAKLKPKAAAQVEAAAGGAEPAVLKLDPKKVPFETATIKGHIKGKGVEARGRKVGSLALGVDVAMAGVNPTGRMTLAMRDLDLGARKIQQIDADITLDGLKHHLTLAVRDAPQRLSLDTAVSALFDLDARRVTATIESLVLQRGALEASLIEQLTLTIDQPHPALGAQTFALPKTKLALAGGRVELSGRATFDRDPANPEAMQLRAMSADVLLRGLSLRRLAAIGRRSTRGLAGTLSGELTVDGTPSDPEVGFDMTIRARQRGAKQAQIKARGGIVNKRLSMDVKVSEPGKQRLLAQLKLKAPLVLQPKPGLARGGKLDVTLDVPKRRLSAFGALLSKGLPPAADPNGTVTAHVKLVGTPGRPTGDFGLTLEGGFLRRRDGMAHMPAAQRVVLSGQLAPSNGKTQLGGTLEVWLDADGASLIDLALDGAFDRSPLLRTGTKRPFKLAATLKPIDLTRVPRKLGEKPLSGTVGATLGIAANATDLTGDVALNVVQVKVGDAPAADATVALGIRPQDIVVDVDALIGGLKALTLDGTIGVAGVGLRRTLKQRDALREAPLALTLAVPKRPLKDWGALRPKLATLPGDVGGTIEIGGVVAAPVADGAIAWDGFKTLDGSDGRVALELGASEAMLTGGLALGAPVAGVAPVRMFASVARAQLKEKQGPLEVLLELRAADVDLLSLVPAFAMGGAKLDVAGVLDMHMDGTLRLLRPEGGAPRLAADSAVLGDLVIRDGRIAVPDTTRVIQDIGVAITSRKDALEITRIHAREADLQNENRTVDVSGTVALKQFKAQGAVLNVKTDRWLVMGRGFDAPEAQLDIDLTVTASRLTEPVKDIDVLIAGMTLSNPDRFPRAHYHMHLDHGDVLYLDETGMPSGKLVPPAPPKPEAAEAPADDAQLASAVAADGAPAAPAGGMDIHLRIPEEIHANQFPLNIWLKGGLEVAMRGTDLDIQGRLDVTRGDISVMGWDWALEEGAVTAAGGVDTAGARMVFSRVPHHTALRDVAMPSTHDGKVFIVINASAATGLTNAFHGVGPTLLDGAALLNTGRARIWGRADLPASEAVQFGNAMQGLVNTFIQTNLRNLVFMDRFNGWSDPVDDRGQYGEIRSFVAQRYINDDGARISWVHAPKQSGRNLIEMRYDWMLQSDERSVIGTGPRFGTDLRLGWGLDWEWSSKD